MVNLIDAKRACQPTLPVSERIESSSEDHILPHASRDSLGQTVLGVSAAHHEPCAPSLSKSVTNKLRDPLLIATREVNQTGHDRVP